MENKEKNKIEILNRKFRERDDESIEKPEFFRLLRVASINYYREKVYCNVIIASLNQDKKKAVLIFTPEVARHLLKNLIKLKSGSGKANFT